MYKFYSVQKIGNDKFKGVIDDKTLIVADENDNIIFKTNQLKELITALGIRRYE